MSAPKNSRRITPSGRNDTDRPGVDERVLFHKLVESYDRWVSSSNDVHHALVTDASRAEVARVGSISGDNKEAALLWLKFAVCALEDGFAEANCRFSGKHPDINPGPHHGCQCKYR